MTVKHWVKTPKAYVVCTMIAFLIIASLLSQTMTGILNGALAVLAGLVTDFVLCRREKRKKIMLDGAVITGLIIALVLSLTSPWYVVVTATVIAILSKHLIVYKKRLLFNPAAFGLFFSVVLFHSRQSWWGAFGDLQAWAMIFLIVGGYIITSRVRKYPQMLSFFATTFILLFLMSLFHYGDAASALRSPFINAALFFGFFMLSDLPTSPVKFKDQIFFGMLVAIVGTIVYGIFGGLMYLFIGLFAGNLYYLYKRIKVQQDKERKQIRIQQKQRSFS